MTVQRLDDKLCAAVLANAVESVRDALTVAPVLRPHSDFVVNIWIFVVEDGIRSAGLDEIMILRRSRTNNGNAG